jgi:hypothetical protein
MEQFPDFFERAPVIRLYDPLAEFLGAAQHGLMEYRYADVVRLAGHSCPTVAAAFLMIRAALRVLYPDEIPVRGGVHVAFRDGMRDGTTGVVANVATLITGATEVSGFKGIAGQFDRRNLLAYNASTAAELRLTRVDTHVAVDVSADVNNVAMNPHMRQLLPRCLSGTAEDAELEQFRHLWQDRVRRLLLEFSDDPNVIYVRAA